MKDPRIPVIYILGDIRSGSSLLERTLTACDTTVATGEQQIVCIEGFEDNNLCSCGTAFDECEFWTAVRHRAAGSSDAMASPEWMAESLPKVDRLRLMPAMRQPRLRSDSFANAWEPVRRSLAAWYAAIYLESGERVIIDSSKSPAYGMLLGTIPSLDIIYVHLARDSRGVAYSNTRLKPRPEITTRSAVMDTFSPGRSAALWTSNYALAMTLRHAHPGRVLEVQYENFVRDPNGVVHTIRDFANRIGFPDIGDLQDDAPLNRYHSVAGNPMRFNRAAPTIKIDDEWRTRMRWHDRILVISLTAPFLLRHHWLMRKGAR